MRGLIAHLPANLAQAVVGFGALAAFTRLLPPEDYGRYALVLSAMMLAHTLLLSWAEAAAFRFYPAARERGELQVHFATLLAVSAAAALGAAAAAAAFALGLGLDHAAAPAAALAALAAGLRFIGKIARETDRAAERAWRYSALESLFVLSGFGAGLALCAWTDLGAAAPIAGLLVGAAIVAVADAPWLIAQARGARAGAARAARYLAYGVPLALALALDLAVQTGLRALVAVQLGEAAVGAHAAAFGLAGRVLDLFFIWTGMAGAPLILSAFEREGPAAAAAVGRRVAATMIALTMPAAVGLSLVAGPLAGIMVGEALRTQAAALVPWMAAAGFAAGLSTYYYSEAFQLSRRTGLRAAAMLAPAALALGLAWLLAPAFGLAGVAAAQTLAAFLGLALLAILGRRLVPLPTPLADVAKAAAACGAMAAAVLALPAWGGFAELALKASVGAVVYAGCALALDMAGVRAMASALLQRILPKVARATGSCP